MKKQPPIEVASLAEAVAEIAAQLHDRVSALAVRDPVVYPDAPIAWKSWSAAEALVRDIGTRLVLSKKV